MFVDARKLPDGTVLETEVCIVGGGAAGITMAREFVQSGFRVALLESGGLEAEAETQDLYDGTSIGRPYQDLTAIRLRWFGGTTNHWEGWCAVMDNLDFESRDGVRYSGWPFPRKHLEPWYRRAQTVCQLGPFGYGPDEWGITPARIPAPFNGPHFICQVLQKSPPTRFGEVYRESLRKAPRLTVYLNANALRFVTGRQGGDVQRLDAGALPHGRFTVKAKIYVLATGAVENTRLLLSSGAEGGNGLGNDNDLVGRFFAVHVEYVGGVIAPADPYIDFQMLNGDSADTFKRDVPREFVSYFALSEATRARERLPGMRIRMHQDVGKVAGLEALKRLQAHQDVMKDLGILMRDLGGVASYGWHRMTRGKGVPVNAITMRCTSEQMPDPDSRITLGKDVDALGLRKVAVDWRLSAADKRGAVFNNRLLAREVGRSGLGRMKTLVSDNDNDWPSDMHGDEHTMGTTRMHRDPKQGVVDADCRVHGTSNLYVAGSSVFPTTGTANPTLTIVALALRLADHIKERLA